jgi:oxygen-independent coproporphyrinogen-3 oxidase
MISLYFHIPFCRKKCDYCDFYSVVGEDEQIPRYIAALKNEISLRKTNEVVDTIFFGGGTPSILKENEFSEIADFIKANFELSPNCEWTIEVNPESFTEEKALNWLENGVNRLSLGIQTLNYPELKICGRAHSIEQALAVLQSGVLERFSSVNVDLIYGLPQQSAESLCYSLQTVCGYSAVNHISLYELTLAENTRFSLEREKYRFPSETRITNIVATSASLLKSGGFERYEVSNFAKDGKRCRHNENYWKNGKYIGLGAAAHSFNGEERSANFSDLHGYMQSLEAGELPMDFNEKLDSKRKRLEFLMLHLRTVDGFSVSAFRRKFKTDILLQNEKYVQSLVKDGYMIIDDDTCKLTDKGLAIADGVAARL